MMKILRTPDNHFDNLPEYKFEPHYTTVTTDGGSDVRIHHIEKGNAESPVIVLMHGNPSWSYLHRKMMKPLAEAGYRAISVDLVGLGRSDKPSEQDDYSLDRHVNWITQWFENNQLKEVTLYCQDWGGAIGMIVVAERPDIFSAVIASNTSLPKGEDESDALRAWIGLMSSATAFPWEMFETNMMSNVSKEVFAAYRAPFPDASYEAGISKFPSLIPELPDNPGVPRCLAAWEKLEHFSKPFLTIFGDSDPVSKGREQEMIQRIPGAKGQNHQIVAGAGHFIQEDSTEELVLHILNFMKS